MTRLEERPQGTEPGTSKSTGIPIWLYITLGLVVVGVGLVTVGPVSKSIEHLISAIENTYQQWFQNQDTNQPIILLPLAFAGGLIASISPCILALLPLNLSYIGTRNITSRWDAFLKAGAFVLGAVTVLSLFGLFSSFAGAVIVDYKGYINVGVGLIILVMGLSLLEVIRIPLPEVNLDLPIAGPFGVGFTFALVSSPCASPVLFAVLAAAAATGSQLLGTLTMVSYALGYTAVIFVSSLFTGLAKQAGGLLNYSKVIIQVGSIALLLTGGYYLTVGALWFL
ncbi:cytochrome c biogenesis protein CcdA [Anthocerotibacter panamensis]|uniref:cytochrome c biogenesis protein CcdA n=1 Tax=Anthocerotibacter panamensis TaxID=2857077 RepID=UPI001C4080C3|nr:cytochrome c biogenesis protein CcdA [Anthocerotibacter panamensis]